MERSAGLVLVVLAACAGDIGGSDAPATTSATATTATNTTSNSSGGGGAAGTMSTSSVGGAGAGGGQPSGPAFLHANLWSTWWNDRTRCGAEYAFLNICKKRGDDCSLIQQAVNVCNPLQVVYGQVGPEKQGEPLCQQSKYPEFGGCDATKHDYDKLRWWWYGAEWQGNWPWATIKIFPQGSDWKGGGELIALSSLPGSAVSAMGGINNHGLGYGCAMKTVSSGDDKYKKPFGGFAWIELPVDTPVTIAAVSATNFAGQSFAGCNRGAATQQPWIPGAPGSELGCVYVLDNLTFKKGQHYYLEHGKLQQLPQPAPPQQLVDGFALPEVGIDIISAAACKL